MTRPSAATVCQQLRRIAPCKLHTVDVESGNLADLVDSLQRAEAAVAVVEYDKPVATLIRPDDYDGLVETLEIVSDAALVAGIEQARAGSAAGWAWTDSKPPW